VRANGRAVEKLISRPVQIVVERLGQRRPKLVSAVGHGEPRYGSLYAFDTGAQNALVALSGKRANVRAREVSK
jgi:hypothetical protein